MTNNQEIRYPFTRQLMFAKVMEDPELCKEFIQRLFTEHKVKDVVVREIVTVNTEDTLIPGVYSKSVRLDVLFDDDNSWYNVEMQVAREDDLPQRGRYYSAAIDVTHLEKGRPYGDLKTSFVIFLCRFDYYDKGEAIYAFERFDKKLQLPYSDGSFIIILNTECAEGRIPCSLKSLYHYINASVVEPDDWFVEKIHQRVLRYQNDEEVTYSMTLEEEYMRKFTKAERKGHEDGLAKGLAEGMEKGLAEGMEKGLAEGMEKGLAEGMEKGLAEGMEKGLAEGMEKGAAEAADRLNKLTVLLAGQGRVDDLLRAAKDAEYQQSLFEEFEL